MKQLKNNSLTWLTVCGLVVLLQREFNTHTYNIICLLAFPVTYVITTWHTIPNTTKRVQQAILISLASFCFFGEKTLFSFIQPFIASFVTLGVYTIIEKYLKR